MMHSPPLRSIGRIAVLCAVFAAGGCASDTEALPDSVSVSSGSGGFSFAGIDEYFQGVYNLPINYEDPLYGDKSGSVFENGHWTVKPREPNSISYSFETPPPDASLETRKELAAKALSDAVRHYNSASGTITRFAANTTANGFDIVPIQTTDNWGQPEEPQLAMDTPITIAPGKRSPGQFLIDFAAALSSAAGKTFTASGILWDPLSTESTTTISASGEPARSVLRRFFKDVQVFYLGDFQHPWDSPENRVPTTLSWHVDCGAEFISECSLKVRIVAPDMRPTFTKPLP
jgi:hypothetical protein